MPNKTHRASPRYTNSAFFSSLLGEEAMLQKQRSAMDERVRFVARLPEGEKMAALCRELAISRKTGYKIFDRYKRSGLAVDAAMGGAPIDKEAAERARKIFVPTRGFCHGNDAHGKSGPDLVRSALVPHDNKGNVIGPAIRNGPLERGMLAFSGLSSEQIQRATPLP